MINLATGRPLAGMTSKPPQSGENACPPPATHTTGESLAALASGGQGADTLPIAIPRSDTLWRLLTNGYDYSFISSLPDGDRDKASLLLRAGARWLQIRAEVNHEDPRP